MNSYESFPVHPSPTILYPLQNNQETLHITIISKLVNYVPSYNVLSPYSPSPLLWIVFLPYFYNKTLILPMHFITSSSLFLLLSRIRLINHLFYHSVIIYHISLYLYILYLYLSFINLPLILLPILFSLYLLLVVFIILITIIFLLRLCFFIIR